MRSPYGTRGQILSHFGWTWNYLLWGIKWNVVLRMLIDMPKYKHEEKEEKKGKSLFDLSKNDLLKMGASIKSSDKDIENYINTLK